MPDGGRAFVDAGDRPVARAGSAVNADPPLAVAERPRREPVGRAVAPAEAEALRQIRLRDLALEKMGQGLCVFDGERRLVLFNRRYAEMYGIAPEALRPGMTLRDVVDLRYAAGTGPDMTPGQYAEWRLDLAVDDRVTETVVELRNGAAYRIHHEPTAEGGWVGTHEDITERREREARIHHMAHHDALTGLPNRALFTERLEEMARGVRHVGTHVAVLVLDLDQFKDVNDTLGHAAGDALLRQAAGRIRGGLEAGETLARLDGDEFAVILPDLPGPASAAALAARVIALLATPFVVEGGEAVIGASIGIAPCDRGREPLDPELLLRRAGLALHRAKGDGRGTYRLFEPGMDTRLQRRKAMERDLRAALAEGQFTLAYQPQLDFASGRITGAEALLRWEHPESGAISPAEFIPVAESTGLIVPIGAWALRTACARAARWAGGTRLAVNLSPLQIREPGLARLVAEVLRETGMPAARLDLEITEGVLMSDTAATLETLGAIRRLGVGIALDDFGTGYSSLSYLRRFPFSKLKIDRSFVRNLERERGAAAIVQAVATLGRSLDMRVTAEGVETAEQLALLRAAGCDEAQGFLVGRPMAAEELERRIATAGGPSPGM